MTNRQTVLERIGSGLIHAISGLVLFLAALWATTYFWLGSTPGRAQLRAAIMDASPVVDVELVRWGPALDRIVVGPSTLVNAEGLTLASLSTALADLDLRALIGGDLRVDRLWIALSYVHANIGPDGRVDLLVAIAPEKRPPTVATTDTPRRPRPTIHIADMKLHIGELTVTTRRVEGLVVRDVALAASITIGDSFRLTSRLEVGRFDATWDRARKNLGFDRLAIDTLEVLDTTVEARGITIQRGAETLLRADITTRGDGFLRATATASLGPSDASVLFPGTFPFGFDLVGLELEFHPPDSSASSPPAGLSPTAHPDEAPDADEEPAGAHRRIAGRLAHLRAPVWQTSIFRADHLDLSLDAFDLELKRLVPRVTLDLGHLAAARFSSLDWHLEGLFMPSGQVTFNRRLDVILGPGRIFGWTLGPSSAGLTPIDTDLVLTADLGLTGGPIQARLTGPSGSFDALGHLKVSPLTGRTSFNTTVRFRDLSGPPLVALAHDLTAEQRAALVGSRGSAVFELDVARSDEPDLWESTITWDEGRFDTEPATLLWDGYAWTHSPPAGPAANTFDDPGVEP